MATDLIAGLDMSANALAAHKLQMRLIAENIANAQTTQGPDGKPYQRKVPVFESLLNEEGVSSVHVKEIKTDKTAGNIIYNPNHPHADKNGYVQMPNVKMSQEMVDMMMASRCYEANLKAFKISSNMAQKTLQLGK